LVSFCKPKITNTHLVPSSIHVDDPNMSDVMKLYIKEFRQIARMTQEELSEKTGKSSPTIQRWESGARIPGADDLFLLAKALGCSEGDFFSHPEKRRLAGVDAKLLQELITDTLQAAKNLNIQPNPEQISNTVSELYNLIKSEDYSGSQLTSPLRLKMAEKFLHYQPSSTH
jgi:transcriptional regulator with XRE-family HTH domain